LTFSLASSDFEGVVRSAQIGWLKLLTEDKRAIQRRRQCTSRRRLPEQAAAEAAAEGLNENVAA